MFSTVLRNLFPFLRWFPMTRDSLRSDFIAGITVALILVPQSMAYAQLAGLPVVFGLYASFVPVIVASLWGSSSQLHTGPVAMLSLMSAAALIPFASPGSPEFIQLSIMLAMLVGVLRLLLGLFRLGAIVNLLSSPVIVGFTNAAALIIGLSQLSKVLGVPFPRTEFYLADLWRVLEQVPHIHWPTLLFAAGTLLLVMLLRRRAPRLPGVLVAVVLSTIISGVLSYENKIDVPLSHIQDPDAVAMIQDYRRDQQGISETTARMAELGKQAKVMEQAAGHDAIARAAALRADAAILSHKLKLLKQVNTSRRVELHAIRLEAVINNDGVLLYHHKDKLPAAGDGRTWRYDSVNGDTVVLSAGGAVVGKIPEGLPSFAVPHVDWALVLALLPAALVMALIGFMEATSISKAISTTTGERVDTSKELIGQGLANIAGSFFGSYTVSGSFSRSAVAAKTGAKTGLFAIISALAVVSVLLFFTTYLYHLPQAVLAVIVMMAVFGLIRIDPLVQAWKVDRVGAVIGMITFFATLWMAPAIANGILLGVVLTVLHLLIRIMKPRAEIVSRKANGTLGGIQANQLEPISQHFVPVRFDGSLNFINVAYFEDIILEAQREFPQARAILVIGSGINAIDSSGEEKVREVARRLEDVGVRLMFSSLKHQVMLALEKSSVVEALGNDAFFDNKEGAIAALQQQYG